MAGPLFLIAESLRDAARWLAYQRRGAFPERPGEDRQHLDRTMDWLAESVRHGRGGSASHYSLQHGRWLAPFPETTGYIIPTMYDYAHFAARPDFSEMATGLTDWLIGVQLDNGACMQGNYDEARGKTEPIVFNTGQNLLGFVRAFRETGDRRYLDAAQKAGDFLVASTDANGVWDRNLLRGLQHTINTRCAWALLQLEALVPGRDYARVAGANLRWTQAQQTENGWFRHGSSKPDVLPNTHFLAYTCRGLIESYRLTGEAGYLETARKTADRFLELFHERPTLYAFWDADWKNRGKHLKWTRGRFVCLTGNAQMALVWMKLFEETGETAYRASAFRILDQLKALQVVEGTRTGVVGGVKGSFPVYGGYSPLKYPNWAAKFFADALMLRIKLEEAA